MDSWVLIVHLLGGGWAEPFASEASCRLALTEARIAWRWERGETEPAVSCRRMVWPPTGDPPPASRPAGREIGTMRRGLA